MRVSESKFRKVIREEVQEVLSENMYLDNDFELGGLPNTIFLVKKPRSYDSDNPIDQITDPGSASRGRGTDLSVVKKKYVSQTSLPQLMTRLATEGEDFLKTVYGVFSNEEDALDHAIAVFERGK